MWRDYKFIVSDNYTSLLTMNRAPYKKNYKKKINSGNHFHNVLCLSEAKGMDIIMKFKMIHENYNVSDLDRSIKFYNEALDLHEVRRKTTDDFIIVYLSNDVSDFELELTWLKDHPQPYNLGECEFHLAFQAEDYEAAHKKHKEMGCICFENEAMGIYFIVDPDGYWLEILP